MLENFGVLKNGIYILLSIILFSLNNTCGNPSESTTQQAKFLFLHVCIIHSVEYFRCSTIHSIADVPRYPRGTSSRTSVDTKICRCSSPLYKWHSTADPLYLWVPHLQVEGLTVFLSQWIISLFPVLFDIKNIF